MAREGLFFSVPFMILAVVFYYIFKMRPDMIFIYLGTGSFCLGCFMILFFRDPERAIPQREDLVLSPADGRIVVLENGDRRVLISVFLSIYNVHINRVPVSGRVERADYRPGKFLAAFKKSASQLNERFEIEIKADKGVVVMHQIAGVIARRVVCRLKAGQYVKAGERFGLIRFGSRVDIILPPSTEIMVRKGQRVKGGKTILGRLV